MPKSGTYRILTGSGLIKGELRTRRDVRSGITRQDVVGRTTTFVYQPGNGRSYTVLATDLSLHRQSFGTGDVLFFVSNFGRGFVAPHGGKTRDVFHYAGVQEKLGCSIFDAVNLAELFGHLTDRPFISVEEFVKKQAG